MGHNVPNRLKQEIWRFYMASFLASLYDISQYQHTFMHKSEVTHANFCNRPALVMRPWTTIYQQLGVHSYLIPLLHNLVFLTQSRQQRENWDVGLLWGHPYKRKRYLVNRDCPAAPLCRPLHALGQDQLHPALHSAVPVIKSQHACSSAGSPNTPVCKRFI